MGFFVVKKITQSAPSQASESGFPPKRTQSSPIRTESTPVAKKLEIRA
jgi:hypothetical protein